MNFNISLDVRAWRLVTSLCILFLVSLSAAAKDALSAPESSYLDRGFSGLYNLDFNAAQRDFASWRQQHPDDPMGPVSEAAGFLFSEFHRLGILEAQFYENDTEFANRPKLTADPAVRQRFQAAIDQAENLAHARLAKDQNDRDGLFAVTLAAGLQADYAALIEKKNLASLHYTKDATASAQRLLSVCNDCYDARLATGFSKYILGSMSAPVRWLLRLGGLTADKDGGVADLQATAEHGHFLAPFARILLAIAYVREKNKPRALRLLAQLHQDFPGNTLFPREIAHLQGDR